LGLEKLEGNCSRTRVLNDENVISVWSHKSHGIDSQSSCLGTDLESVGWLDVGDELVGSTESPRLSWIVVASGLVDVGSIVVLPSLDGETELALLVDDFVVLECPFLICISRTHLEFNV